mgnify:CR=1 FL=1|jgi:hypothetical protein
MGLNVRIYNIISNGNYTIRYKSGNNPYPVETDSTFTLLGSYTPSTTEITISGLTFDTHYWVKMTDTTTGRYIVQNIFTHDSKAFPCYDTICFSVDVICPTPTPTPTITPTISVTPTPTPTVSPSPTESPGDPVDCSEGMDVVFLLDYTGSMGTPIDGIKTSISNIVNTIVTESNNNYRLGLVIFDEWNSQTISSYSSVTGYTSLPSSQRYINVGVAPSYQWITAVEMMQTNNQTSFTTQLNQLNTTNFPLGYGVNGPEPADMGIDLVGTENFAGTFRTGVSKLIILITDERPGGNDDAYTQTDINFVNSLIPQLYNQNIRVLLMTSYGSTVLNDLAIGTNGIVSSGFTGSAIITAIENICIPGATPTPTVTPTTTTTPTTTPTTTITTTPTSTTCSEDVRNTLSATNAYTAVGRQGMVYSSSNNKAYVLDSYTNSVKSFVPNSTTLTTEFTWSVTSYLLGYNSTNNKLYSWGGFPVSMNIRNLNTNTSSSVSISGLTGAGQGKIEYNSVLNKIYAFSQSVNFTTAQISVIDGSSDTFTNQITGLTLSNVHATVYNPNNNKLYFAQGGSVYTCSGNTISLDATTLPIISASLIALDETYNIIYLVTATTIYKIDASTNTTISMTPITGGSWVSTSLRSMTFNPDNGKLYVSRYSTSTDGFLGVLDTSTGGFTEIIGDGISQPLYVPTNTIYGINDTALYEICGENILT